MADVKASGHIKGTRITVKAKLGGAKIKMVFDAEDPGDETGMGDIDYLLSGLPMIAERVLDGIQQKIDAEAVEE